MKTLTVTTSEGDTKKFENTDELEHTIEFRDARLEIEAAGEVVAVFDAGRWQNYIWTTADN